ncbi:MAG: Holliday junction branch migration protein RuvA, partial [Clostridia bacterium]|nr:Holliday junction branch migration protein RuvA [Clostridia bacterium]
QGIDVSKLANADHSSNIRDAVEALVSLGYSQSDSYSAVGRLDPAMSTDELIKTALKNLSKGSLR